MSADWQHRGEEGRCERCGKPVVPGTRWCRGHAYIGTRYTPPAERQSADVAEPEEQAYTLLDRIRRALGGR